LLTLYIFLLGYSRLLFLKLGSKIFLT